MNASITSISRLLQVMSIFFSDVFVCNAFANAMAPSSPILLQQISMNLIQTFPLNIQLKNQMKIKSNQ